MTADVDATDPLVVALSWGLTWLVGRIPAVSGLRWALPIVAVLLAVGARAAMDAAQGAPLSWSTALRGLAAGASAVFAHSQFRELVKQVPPTGNPDGAR